MCDQELFRSRYDATADSRVASAFQSTSGEVRQFIINPQVPDGRKVFLLTDDRTEMLEALDHPFFFSLAIGNNVVGALSHEVRRLQYDPDLPRVSDRRGLTVSGREG